MTIKLQTKYQDFVRYLAALELSKSPATTKKLLLAVIAEAALLEREYQTTLK